LRKSELVDSLAEVVVAASLALVSVPGNSLPVGYGGRIESALSLSTEEKDEKRTGNDHRKRENGRPLVRQVSLPPPSVPP